MNFFKVVLLIGTLVGMLGVKSCPGVEYVSVKTPSYEAAKIRLLDEIEVWFNSSSKVFDSGIKVEASAQEIVAALEENKIDSNSEKFLPARAAYRDALGIYEKLIASYKAAEVKFESAITAVEQAAAADALSSELEKKQIEKEKAILEKIAKYKEQRESNPKALEEIRSKTREIDPKDREEEKVLYAIYEECKKLEEYKKILPILGHFYKSSKGKVRNSEIYEVLDWTALLLNKKRRLKSFKSILPSPYDVNGVLEIPENLGLDIDIIVGPNGKINLIKYK